MKVSRIRMANFKRFKEMEINFINDLTKDISDQFLILGDNGSGKTTVFQAIALCLSMASGKIKNAVCIHSPVISNLLGTRYCVRA